MATDPIQQKRDKVASLKEQIRQRRATEEAVASKANQAAAEERLDNEIERLESELQRMDAQAGVSAPAPPPKPQSAPEAPAKEGDN